MKELLIRLRGEYGSICSMHEFLALLKKNYSICDIITAPDHINDTGCKNNAKEEITSDVENEIGSYADCNVKPKNCTEKNLAPRTKISIEDETSLNSYVDTLKDFSVIEQFFKKNKEFDSDKAQKKYYKKYKEKFLKDVEKMYAQILKDDIDEETSEIVATTLCEIVYKYFVQGILQHIYNCKSYKQVDNVNTNFWDEYKKAIQDYLRQIGFRQINYTTTGTKLTEIVTERFQLISGKRGNRIKEIRVQPYQIFYIGIDGTSISKLVQGIACTTDDSEV